jgi:hypothetical protein
MLLMSQRHVGSDGTQPMGIETLKAMEFGLISSKYSVDINRML